MLRVCEGQERVWALERWAEPESPRRPDNVLRIEGSHGGFLSRRGGEDVSCSRGGARGRRAER